MVVQRILVLECVKKRDGRDRTKATIVDHYDPNIPNDKRIKEQKAINKYGPLKNLDNKRNEIQQKDWKKYGIDEYIF